MANDEMESKTKDNGVATRPMRTVDKNTLDLIEVLRRPEAYGGHEDYFKEYDYEDISS